MKLENGPSPHIPKQPYVTEILSAQYDQKGSTPIKEIAWETTIGQPVLHNIVTFIRRGYHGPITVADILPDPNSMEQTVEQRDMIAYVLQLSKHITIPHAQDVIRLRYQEGLKLKEAGKRLGITANQVGEIERRAIYGLQELIRQLDNTKEKHGNMIGNPA